MPTTARNQASSAQRIVQVGERAGLLGTLTLPSKLKPSWPRALKTLHWSVLSLRAVFNEP